MSAKSNTLEIVEPTPTAKAENLITIANELRETHVLASQHAQLAIAFAVRYGLLCEKAKAALPHGKFDDWLEANKLPKATAYRNRQLAKSSTMELLPADELTAPDFLERVETDKQFRTELAAKVYEVAGEATVTDVMKDLGIIKPAANVDADTGKRIHHPAKKLSPDQLAKQNRAAAKALIVRALGDLKAALDDKQAKRWLQAKDWTDLRKLAGDRMKQLNAIADKAEAAAAKQGGKQS